MQKQTLVTREELDELMREIESVKSTIEILRDEEAMKNIKESEEFKRKGIKPWKIEY